ncbi:hypothetical protein DFH09DRAFT_1077824 [Mycena vulgaris]|nr:hypothetical protein DFH09DRAFT_1077824 [Mycena vulgaris]
MSIPSARLRTVAAAFYDIGAASRGAREARAARCIGWAHGLAGVRRRGAGESAERRAGTTVEDGVYEREDELGRDVLPQRAHKLRHLAAAVAAGGKGGREGAAGEARGEERRGKGEGGGARRKYRCGRVGAEGSGALPAAQLGGEGASAAAREEGGDGVTGGVAAGEGGFLVEEERAELRARQEGGKNRQEECKERMTGRKEEGPNIGNPDSAETEPSISGGADFLLDPPRGIVAFLKSPANDGCGRSARLRLDRVASLADRQEPSSARRIKSRRQRNVVRTMRLRALFTFLNFWIHPRLSKPIASKLEFGQKCKPPCPLRLRRPTRFLYEHHTDSTPTSRLLAATTASLFQKKRSDHRHGPGPCRTESGILTLSSAGWKVLLKLKGFTSTRKASHIPSCS